MIHTDQPFILSLRVTPQRQCFSFSNDIPSMVIASSLWSSGSVAIYLHRDPGQQIASAKIVSQ
jgi:hypothetical protein